MSLLSALLDGFKQWLVSLFELLPQLRHLWSLLKRLLAGLWRWQLEHRCRRRGGPCVDIPGSEYRRPDPLLYSQPFLMAQGLAVTWDNPDIQLYDQGAPAGSHNLLADHDYEVVVRVWNNSYHAPAANLPVYLSFLAFGIGTTSTPVGKTYVDLGVKASAHCPAYAKFTWHTPAAAGHYCLQALLDWPDDANPDNNLGQENTNVGQLHSPAVFTFLVRNDASVVRRFELEPDRYALPGPPPCEPEPDEIQDSAPSAVRPTRLAESRRRWAEALQTQGRGRFPVEPPWEVRIEPRIFDLEPRQERLVQVEIERTGGGFIGRQPFNINGFASAPEGTRTFVGGVTLIVEGS